MREAATWSFDRYKFLVRAVKSALVVGGLVCVALHAEEPASITVKMSRTVANSGNDVIPLQLWANGNQLGSVDAGKDVTFKLLPTDSGSYTFDTRTFAGQRLSQSITVRANPGSTILVTASTSMLNSPIHVTVLNTSQRRSRVLSARLTNRYLEKELSREIVTTPRGAKRTVKRIRSFEHVVTIGSTTGVDSSLKADLSIISAEIRGKLEASNTQAFKESETIEQTVEIDGNLLARVALVWVERRQLGSATISVNGAPLNLTFQFGVELELRLQPISK
jgi:hypothetical protein